MAPVYSEGVVHSRISAEAVADFICQSVVSNAEDLIIT